MTTRLLVKFVFPSCGTTSYPNVLTILPVTGVYDFLSDYEAAGWVNAGRATVTAAALFDPIPKTPPVIPTTNLVAISGTYTLASLPDPTTSQWSYIYVSDIWDGQGGVLSSDGAVWRPIRQYAAFTRSGDQNLTFTPLASSPYQILTGTLTAPRTMTLSTTNAYDGALCHVTRTSGGLFSTTVNGVTLALNQWGEWVYASGSWRYVASAGLL